MFASLVHSILILVSRHCDVLDSSGKFKMYKSKGVAKFLMKL